MHEVQCRGKGGTALRATRRRRAQVDVQTHGAGPPELAHTPDTQVCRHWTARAHAHVMQRVCGHMSMHVSAGTSPTCADAHRKRGHREY
eukprot:64634-Alexandrium_andersonii.AAC.1